MLTRTVKNIRKFLDLSDTPSSITAGQLIRGNADGDALEFFQWEYYPESYGAVGDGQMIADGAISSSTTTLTSASNPFVSGDVGKSIVVTGAEAAGGQLSTTIASYTSVGEVELTASASTTVSSANVSWGTDDTTAIQDAIDASYAAGGGVVRFSGQRYIVLSQVEVKQNVVLEGLLYALVGAWNVSPLPHPMTYDQGTVLCLYDESNPALLYAGDFCGARNLILHYQNQVKATDSTPIAYPVTISCDYFSTTIENIVFTNSYDAIDITRARHIINNLIIGAIRDAIKVDNCWDYTTLSNVEVVPVWEIIEGISPATGDALTRWMMANGHGLKLYKADGLSLANIRMFRRYIGILLDANGSGGNSYGVATNIQLDRCVYSLKVNSMNTTAAWNFTGLHLVGETEAGYEGQYAIWMASANSKITIEGGAVWGTWQQEPLKVDAGEVEHHNVRGLSDQYNTFSDGDATPTTKLGSLFKTANTGATTVTSFDDGYQGQEIEVLFGDGNTTLSETGNIKITGATTLTPGDGDAYRFRYDGTNWWQVGGGGGSGGGDLGVDGGTFGEAAGSTEITLDGGTFGN